MGNMFDEEKDQIGEAQLQDAYIIDDSLNI